MLKVILESPKRFKAEYIDKKIVRKESAALNFGSAIHLALLEPQVFLKRYAVEPDVRRNTTIYKDWREAVLASDPTAVIVSQDDMDNLNGVIEAVMAHPKASAMLRKGIPERSIYQRLEVEFPEGGSAELQARVRPDYLHESGDIIDVKTTIDVEYRAFCRQQYDLGYGTSMAYYREVVNAEFGKKDRHCWWICLEKKPPYEVAVYRADEAVMDRGEQAWKKAVWLLNECRKTGVWPGKQREVQDMGLPGYAQYE